MGLFSSKKKTTYYSNHIEMVKMDHQFKPYVNSLVMSVALKNDRYLSATDILKDGLYNSPKQGLLKLFRYQSKYFGKQSELYAPTGDYSNYDFRPILGLEMNETYSIENLEDSFFEPDYYVLQWVQDNRPDLLPFRDDFQTEYIKTDHKVYLEINGEKLSIDVPKLNEDERTLNIEFIITKDHGNKPFISDTLLKYNNVSEIPSTVEGFNKVSDESNKMTIVLEKEVKETAPTPFTKVTNSSHDEILKVVRFENRKVSQEDYLKGIIGYAQVFREIVKYKETVDTQVVKRYQVIDGKYQLVVNTITTTTQTYHKEIIKSEYSMKNATGLEKRSEVFIYVFGTGNTELDNIMSYRRSLGTKIAPLVVKMNNVLISPNYRSDLYDFNNRCMKKFSSSVTGYADLYKNFSKDGMKDIKEAIMLFGVSIDMNKQFAIEYCFRFFSNILNLYGIREGDVNANSICRQSAGKLYYNPEIENVNRVFKTGVYNPNNKLNRVYTERGKGYIKYIAQRKGFYEVITVNRGGQSVQSSEHWINHGVSYSEGESTNRDAIIPLLESVVKQMPVKYIADVAKYSPSLLLTTFEVTKIRWYQRGIFKIIIAVVIIVISIFFPPAGGAMAAVAGTIGATVAAYMALTGLTYLVVATAINTVIGMVVAQVVSTMANKFIGGTLGNLVSAVLSAYLTGSILSGDFSINITNALSTTFSVENLLSLSTLNTLGSMAVNMHFQNRMKDLQNMEKHINDLKDQLKEVKEKSDELFGSSSLLNTQQLLESIDSDVLPSDIINNVELPDTFINRALLNGSDIVDMTLSIIYDYTEIELSRKTFINSSE